MILFRTVRHLPLNTAYIIKGGTTPSGCRLRWFFGIPKKLVFFQNWFFSFAQNQKLKNQRKYKKLRLGASMGIELGLNVLLTGNERQHREAILKWQRPRTNANNIT